MKRLVLALVLVLPIIALGGCTPAGLQETQVVERPVPSDDEILYAARQAFGENVVADATMDYLHDEADSLVDVEIVLDTAGDLESLDRSAVQVLTYIASVDTSDTPISLRIISRDLAPTASNAQWGALFYEWRAAPGQPGTRRGDTIYLAYGETDPPGTSYDSFYSATERGVWSNVDVDALIHWSAEGMPEAAPTY